MNNTYKRHNIMSAPFMSNNTFISWFFSWITKFKLDFRQQCSICKFQPKMLAADGTKIGINIRHSTVVPIETPTTGLIINSCHRRNDRAFISFTNGDPQSKSKTQSRDHLLYLANKVLHNLDAADVLPDAEEKKRNAILLQHLDVQFHSLLQIFMLNSCSNRISKKIAVLLTILSTNHSISSVIPYRYIDEFQAILNAYRNDAYLNTAQINKVCMFSPEIRYILLAVRHDDICTSVLNFLDHLLVRVENIFVNCKQADEIQPKPGTYNPAKYGRAYYFTEHGNQI